MDRREAYYMERVRQYGPIYSSFDLATCESVLNLLFTYDALHQCTARYMSEPADVASLRAPPEGMQLHELGDLLLVSRANVTGLIDHLDQKGYVTRVVDQQDR